MILRTRVQKRISENALKKPCQKAEHEAAIQAERDCRRFIPSSRIMTSGTVNGNVIVWNTPFTRVLYFGKIYEDPRYKAGGIPRGDGTFFSRKGVKKLRSERDFRFSSGQAFWFRVAKNENLAKWLRIMQREVDRG